MMLSESINRHNIHERHGGFIAVCLSETSTRNRFKKKKKGIKKKKSYNWLLKADSNRNVETKQRLGYTQTLN